LKRSYGIQDNPQPHLFLKICATPVLFPFSPSPVNKLTLFGEIRSRKFMKNYKLQPNEVVRFQAPITLQTEKGDIPADLK
jgi:hypothetical protein